MTRSVTSAPSRNLTSIYPSGDAFHGRNPLEGVLVNLQAGAPHKKLQQISVPSAFELLVKV